MDTFETKMRVFNLQFNTRMSCPCKFASLRFIFLPAEWILKIQSRISLWEGTHHVWSSPWIWARLSCSPLWSIFNIWLTFQVNQRCDEQTRRGAVCLELLSRYFLISSFSSFVLDPPFFFFFFYPYSIKRNNIAFRLRFVKRKGGTSGSWLNVVAR